MDIISPALANCGLHHPPPSGEWKGVKQTCEHVVREGGGIGRLLYLNETQWYSPPPTGTELDPYSHTVLLSAFPIGVSNSRIS